jgi:hypothetical protein
MKIEKIIKKIRERYACGWKLTDDEAENLILDFANEHYTHSIRVNSQHPSKANKPKRAESID